VTVVDIEIRGTGPRTTIALVGELDRAGCGALRDCVDVLEQPVRTVILDLSELTFIDGAGIATLVSLADSLDVGMCNLEIVRVTGQVQRVLELTGVSSALGVASA
jgi:anti-anti-sigma factor